MVEVEMDKIGLVEEVAEEDQTPKHFFIFLVVPPFASPPPFHTDIVYISEFANIADLESLPDFLYDNRSAYPASLGIAYSYALRQKIESDRRRLLVPRLACIPPDNPPLAIAGLFYPATEPES